MKAFSFHACWSLAVARFRWKLYKASVRLALGPSSGDRNLIFEIASTLQDPDTRDHLISTRLIKNAYCESFAYPDSYPTDFARRMAVSDRWAYVLKDVALSSETGAMWIPGRRVLIESLGHLVHFFAWGGFIDVLRSPVRVDCDLPVTPCSNLGYYHWLLDAMGQVLLADELTHGQFRIAVSGKASRFVWEGLEFFGYSRGKVIVCDEPLLASRVVLIARHEDLALVPRDNIRVLQKAIRSRVIVPDCRVRKVYISRRLESNRAVVNEDEIEHLVQRYGFEICYFEKLPFSEQMQIVAESRVVMGVHGAGMSNIIAGSPGLKVIELSNPNWFNPCYSRLALQLGFEYAYTMLNRTEQGISADISAIDRLLQENV